MAPTGERKNDNHPPMNDPALCAFLLYFTMGQLESQTEADWSIIGLKNDDYPPMKTGNGAMSADLPFQLSLIQAALVLLFLKYCAQKKTSGASFSDEV